MSDVGDHVQRIQPGVGQSESTFRKKVRALWNEKTMQEHERILSTQIQAFTLIVSLQRRYVDVGIWLYIANRIVEIQHK
jgi:hypothetical protein